MKKTMISILLAAAFVFSGCTSVKKDTGSNQNMGITTNKVAFSTITELSTLPSSLSEKIDQLKENKGYFYVKDGNDYYMVVFSGIKNTGGYSIQVISVEDIEGITKVIVEEKSPGKDEMVTQVITYPLTVIKLPLIHERVQVTDSKGNEFKKLD